ncbi:hypothetical protein GQS40_01660|uniref:Uncharacterized protein n=1 Tax=Leuconostoc lactis TaxID=1246 RepID=A0A6L7A5S4_LEULA|nr:hypothetical protein [Leuconostoc lactis]
MIPIIPMFIVNYTANKLKLPDKVTYLSMFIGSIPSAVLLSVGGDAIFRGHSTPELKVVLAGVPTSMVGVLIGVYFGPAIGILLNIIGTFTGNSLSFILISHFKILSKPHTKNRWVRFISSAKHPAIKTIVSILVGAITIILLLLLTKNLYPDVLSLINPHTPAADIRAQIRSHGITTAFLLTATLALFCLIP